MLKSAHQTEIAENLILRPTFVVSVAKIRQQISQNSITLINIFFLLGLYLGILVGNVYANYSYTSLRKTLVEESKQLDKLNKKLLEYYGLTETAE